MSTVEILVLLPLTLWLSFSIQFWRKICHKRRLYKHCGTNSATLGLWTFNSSFLLLLPEVKLV